MERILSSLFLGFIWKNNQAVGPLRPGFQANDVAPQVFNDEP